MNAVPGVKIKKLDQLIFKGHKDQIEFRALQGYWENQFDFGFNSFGTNIDDFFLFNARQADLVHLRVVQIISLLTFLLEPQNKLFPSNIVWMHMINSTLQFLDHSGIHSHVFLQHRDKIIY